MIRRLLVAVVAAMFALGTLGAEAASKRHYANQGGHYVGGSKGSSHKGGTYRNSRTGNHYTKH